MKNPSTDLLKETPEEQDKRINAMLNCMVVEASLFALEHDEPPQTFTRDQIGDFCGCSKDTIRRIEEQALRKAKNILSQ